MVKVAGLAVPFDVPTADKRNHGMRTAFARDAFDATVSRFETQLLVNHVEPSAPASPLVLATTADRSLRLIRAVEGLQFVATVRDPFWANLLTRAQRNRVIRGVSIGWSADVGDRNLSTGIYTIESAWCREISVLIGHNEPRFTGTWAGVTAAA